MSNTPSRAEIEALVKRHGATSYRNRADTQHPAYGFTEDGLNGLIDEVLAKWGTPQQEATKAAPGGSVNGWPVEAAIYKRRDEWVLELSGTINDCAFTCRHTQPGYLQPEDVAGLPSLYSEGTAPQPAPAPLSDDVVRDAARWRMAALIGNEVMLHPDKRTHATAVKAYMDATHSGLDLTGAVDAALAAQGGKDA